MLYRKNQITKQLLTPKTPLKYADSDLLLHKYLKNENIPTPALFPPTRLYLCLYCLF